MLEANMENNKKYLVDFVYIDSEGVERRAKDYFYAKELILVNEIDSSVQENDGEEHIFKIGDAVQIDLSNSDTDDDRLMNCYDYGRGVVIHIYDKGNNIEAEEGEYLYEK